MAESNLTQAPLLQVDNLKKILPCRQKPDSESRRRRQFLDCTR